MIETERLTLRGWRAGDAAEFARVTNTPAVMAHLGGVVDPADFIGYEARSIALQAEHGCCFWIVERRTDRAMLGFCGLQPGTVGPIGNEIEIGWRLRQDAWGQGFAREAAEASLVWGWAHLGVPRIVAITVPANRASWRLMERLSMARRAELDFGHPAFPEGHELHRHIAYAAERP